jgi:competence protein ComEC
VKNKSTISNVSYLKVPHHGSSNGLNETILDILKPKIAVISLSKENKYGFPHKQTMDLLQKIGADIHRTDLQGTIDIIVN